MIKKIICVIPARGGSKRIKNKNIKSFLGKPMISYPIKAALKSKLFKKIIVSTDKIKIKKIAEKFGAKVPFLRDKKISDYKTGLVTVLLNAIRELKIKDDYVFLVNATSPLLRAKDLVLAFKRIISKKADGLVAVSSFDYNPLRAFCYNKKKIFLKFKWPKFRKRNSQDLQFLFHDTGTFYIYKVKSLLKYKNLCPKKTIPYFLKRYDSIDIDDSEDLKFAEFLFKFKKD